MEKQALTNYVREIEQFKKNAGWFLAFGIILILLGLGVISTAYYGTIFSVILLGVFLLGAGVVQIIEAFMARKWSGVFLSLLLGLLYIVIGFLCVSKPTVTAVNITLLIAAFLFIAGLFRIFSALIIRFDRWGWVLFNGIITLLLGIMIYADWPLSGLWVIGIFVGVDMILTGWSWITLANLARREIK